MPVRIPQAAQNRIAKLQREIRELQFGAMLKKQPTKAPHRHAEVAAQEIRKKPERANFRPGRVQIARGINLSTVPGSLYSTILRVYAALGRLDQHEHLFATFEKAQTPESALVLLKEIGVARAELDPFVRMDEEFQQHCNALTERYHRRARAGDVRAVSILKDPKICDENGRWIGDIDEAVHILRGARTLRQVRRGRNQRILNQVHMMFDTAEIGGVELGFLFRQRRHRLFKRAVLLAQSHEEKNL